VSGLRTEHQVRVVAEQLDDGMSIVFPENHRPAGSCGRRCGIDYNRLASPQAVGAEAGTNLGTPPAPRPPAKNSPVAGIAFVILLCAAIAAVFVFGGKIFKSTGGQINQVTSAPNEVKKPLPAPTKPIIGRRLSFSPKETA